MQAFQGNSDRASEVKHVLYKSFEAYYLRILPNVYYGAVCMRMEVFGVKRKAGYYTQCYDTSGKHTFWKWSFILTLELNYDREIITLYGKYHNGKVSSDEH